MENDVASVPRRGSEITVTKISRRSGDRVVLKRVFVVRSNEFLQGVMGAHFRAATRSATSRIPNVFQWSWPTRTTTAATAIAANVWNSCAPHRRPLAVSVITCFRFVRFRAFFFFFAGSGIRITAKRAARIIRGISTAIFRRSRSAIRVRRFGMNATSRIRSR